MKIISYGRQYIDKNDHIAVKNSLNNDLLTSGPFVKNFEKDLQKQLNSNYITTCTSGTSALQLAFKSIEIKKNDVVVMPIVNFVSASNILFNLGARIYYADVDPVSGLMTPKTLNECLKKNKLKKIKLLLTMYLGGNCENNILFYKIKKKLKCYLIEDACHALGTKYRYLNKDYHIGSCKHSDISIFSLHPVKSITTGEGGFMATNNYKFYKKSILFRSHGIIRGKEHWLYDIKEPGYNYRLSDLNCSLGISQLKKLDRFIEKRNQIAKIYFKKIKNIPYIKIPEINEDVQSAYHLFIIHIDFLKIKKKKKDLIKFFLRKKIRLQQHYIPINKFSFYKSKIREKFANSDIYFKNSISLPIYYSCQKKVIEKIIKNLRDFIKN